MTDAQNVSVSRKDWNGIYVPKHTAKLVKAGIENASAPFLPKNGHVSPMLIVNANTGYALEAKDLIPVSLERAAKGYESAAVGTFNTAAKAHTRIKEGEQGVWYNFKGADGEFHHAAYFFAEQTLQPERFSQFAQQNTRQQQRLTGAVISVTSPEPADYLAAYVAACKSGAQVEVSPKAAELFKQNMLDICNNELVRTNAEKNPRIPKLNDVLFAADKKANELVKSLEKERGIAQPQQQKKNERRIDRSVER